MLEGGLYTEELTIEKIREDVYIVNHKFPWSANSMIVRCSNSIFVWLDTLYNNDAKNQLLDCVTSQFSRIRIVEITDGTKGWYGLGAVSVLPDLGLGGSGMKINSNNIKKYLQN